MKSKLSLSNNTNRIIAQLQTAIAKNKDATKIIEELVKSAYNDGVNSVKNILQ